MEKACNIFLAVAFFYFVGIIVNGIVLKEIFGLGADKMIVWSVEGFSYLALAGLSGFLSYKLYLRLNERNR